MSEQQEAQQLCADVAADGVYAGKNQEWPHCVDPGRCRCHGCYWRRWHQLTTDRLVKPERSQ